MLHELKTGDKPAGVALSRDGRRGAVTHWYGYDLAILDIKDDKITVAGRVEVGPEPRGVAMTADGSTAFVAVGVSNEVVRVDLNARKVTGRLAVGREPRGIALSPDESQLLVGNARSQDVSLIDVRNWKVVEDDPDRRRQPPPGRDQPRRQDRLRRQHEEPAIPHHPEQHRPGLGARPAADAGRRSMARPTFATLSLDTQGKAAGRRPRRRRQPRPEATWPSVAAERTR